MFEDEAPKPLAGYRLGDSLDRMSVGDLGDLLNDLQAEIERVQSELRRKRGGLSDAESLFKS